MVKIVVTKPMDFLPAEKERLEKLGDVRFHDDLPATSEEWLERCKGFDIVCTGLAGVREKYAELHDVFISLPFVGVGWADPAVLKAKNITISNSPGCNRHPVSEWIIGMIILMMRQLDQYLNVKELPVGYILPVMTSPAYKNVTILGKGNIGTRVGIIAKALEMDVTYFRRGDDLYQSVKNADVVVDTLSLNPTTENLLNKKFFQSLKNGAIFVSVTNGPIVDIDAMLGALDSGKLAYAAYDGGGIAPGDTRNAVYQKLVEHPKVYVTPHIAYNSDVERKMGNDMMIDNVEAWLNGKPINLVN